MWEKWDGRTKNQILHGLNPAKISDNSNPDLAHIYPRNETTWPPKKKSIWFGLNDSSQTWPISKRCLVRGDVRARDKQTGTLEEEEEKMTACEQLMVAMCLLVTMATRGAMLSSCWHHTCWSKCSTHKCTRLEEPVEMTRWCMWTKMEMDVTVRKYTVMYTQILYCTCAAGFNPRNSTEKTFLDLKKKGKSV